MKAHYTPPFASLAHLGWQPFFQQQLSIEEWDEVTPARIIEQYKAEITVATETDLFNIPLLPNMPDLVVGDWLLLDVQQQLIRLLERKTCFARKAAGSKVKRQLISANVDTAFIVCAMNDDFNLSRIERFLSLVNEAGAEPLILLSKADQCSEPELFVQQAQTLNTYGVVEAINCLDPDSVTKLQPWIKVGSTLAVLGSSGVGKSTLVNTLLGESKQATQNTREDDDKGRHTTTSRSLIALKSGGLILDTPGMREIQLVDSQEGIAITFADIEDLASKCRYGDCQHQSEPGCAVQQAIASGDLEERRLQNYLKLQREDVLNSASLADRRAQDKALGKFYKRTLGEAYKLKGR